jgi:hypothetical protein
VHQHALVFYLKNREETDTRFVYVKNCDQKNLDHEHVRLYALKATGKAQKSKKITCGKSMAGIDLPLYLAGKKLFSSFFTMMADMCQSSPLS